MQLRKVSLGDGDEATSKAMKVVLFIFNETVLNYL